MVFCVCSTALQWCQDPKVLLGGLAAVSDGRCWMIWLQWSNGAALSLSSAPIDPARRVVGPQPVPLRLRLFGDFTHPNRGEPSP